MSFFFKFLYFLDNSRREIVSIRGFPFSQLRNWCEPSELKNNNKKKEKTNCLSIPVRRMRPSYSAYMFLWPLKCLKVCLVACIVLLTKSH